MLNSSTLLMICCNMNTESYSDLIVKSIREGNYRPLSLKKLAEQLGVPEKQYRDFQKAAQALHEEGRVILGEGHTVLPPDLRGRIIGTYRANARGFGFVIPESVTTYGDLYIPPGQQKSAVTGDTVLAKVLKKGKRGSRMAYEGRIVQIIERGQSEFVGRLQKEGLRWLCVPDGRAWREPIYIPDAAAKKPRPNMQVVVQIVQYPTADSGAEGVITEVLGLAGEPGVYTTGIIKQHHLPGHFSEQCIQQAQQAAQGFDPECLTEGRVDLRNETLITIDPDDAKDFDDAVSVSNEGQEWELGVHIADVSHFVQTDSPLDNEARERGNSVYLPGQVIPMLPEVLSNGVCSLQENVPRFAKSVFVRYDAEGNVLKQRFCNTVIKSSKRLTYSQATSMLDGKIGGYKPQVVELIRDMDKLARIIRQRRLAKGMITLDLPGVELVLGEDGGVTDVVPEDKSFSHTIIEMFMIEANEAAARLLTDKKLPHLRRIHPEPDAQAGTNLADFLNVRGHHLSNKHDRAEIQEVIQSVRGKPESPAVNLAVLRSLAQAEYTPKLMGHYALGSECYAHFTSPIRRYPDLTIHRLIDHCLADESQAKPDQLAVPSRQKLTELGTHCSFTERRAENAERELHTVKVLQFLLEHIDEKSRGVVTGVAEFGLFVQLNKYGVDGLVRRDDLPGDRWEVLPDYGCLVCRTSGRQIGIGDEVEVTIVRINVPSRQLDLHLEKQVSSCLGTAKKATPKQDRSTGKRSGESRKPSSRRRRSR